jgi:hypothetical protein
VSFWSSETLQKTVSGWNVCCEPLQSAWKPSLSQAVCVFAYESYRRGRAASACGAAKGLGNKLTKGQSRLVTGVDRVWRQFLLQISPTWPPSRHMARLRVSGARKRHGNTTRKRSEFRRPCNRHVCPQSRELPLTGRWLCCLRRSSAMGESHGLEGGLQQGQAACAQKLGELQNHWPPSVWRASDCKMFPNPRRGILPLLSP